MGTPPPCPPASRSERQPLLAWIPGAEHGRLSCGRGRAGGRGRCGVVHTCGVRRESLLFSRFHF